MRIGFLGAGLIATFHSKMLRSAREVERAGVFDHDPARAEAFAAASGHHVCSSVDEVLDSCDAVYVCTWTSEHPAQVAAAAARGLPVFVEKPLATSLAGAEALTALVLEAGITNQVGLILRRSPVFLTIRGLIDDPAAGRLMSIVFRDDQYLPVQGQYESTWRADPNKAGSGTLLEHSIHDVDMLSFLAGPIQEVSARIESFHGNPGIEDVATGWMSFESGVTATLNSVWHMNMARPSMRRVEVFCEHRWIALDGNDWYGPVRWTDSDGSGGVLEGPEIVGRGEELLAQTPHGGPANPDVAFVESILAGSPAYPDVNVALEAHRWVDAMYRSAADRGAVVARS